MCVISKAGGWERKPVLQRLRWKPTRLLSQRSHCWVDPETWTTTAAAEDSVGGMSLQIIMQTAVKTAMAAALITIVRTVMRTMKPQKMRRTYFLDL